MWARTVKSNAFDYRSVSGVYLAGVNGEINLKLLRLAIKAASAHQISVNRHLSKNRKRAKARGKRAVSPNL